MSPTRSVALLLLTVMAVVALTTTVHYVRLSHREKHDSGDDTEARVQLFNHRLMTVVSLVVAALSLTALAFGLL